MSFVSQKMWHIKDGQDQIWCFDACVILQKKETAFATFERSEKPSEGERGREGERERGREGERERERRLQHRY